ncbi:MAG: histidine--tRNA ligase [Candidatus Babeliales bacterium]|jgi:histidyl-tRNA synthetase
MHHSSCGIPRGMTEFFGVKFMQRQRVIDTIETVYKEYGFDPLSTPILEHAQVFSGHHGEGESLLFHLKDRKLHDLVMRYDLTVPMARYIADHPEAPIPFKQYQIATVFRDDEVDKGHFREFTQCDGDVIGVREPFADAEVISMAFDGLSRLGFSDFVININHRSIIKALAKKSGFDDREGELLVQRSMDEVSKFSEKWVHHENPAYQDIFITHVHEILTRRSLPDEAIKNILFICTLKGDLDQKLESTERFFGDFHEGARGVKELKEIFSYLNVEVKKRVKFDLLLARGADYYTGFILEGSIPFIPVGAVLGGGRYDNLVKDFGGPDLPAVGMAFGLDRILTAQAELNFTQDIEHDARILVVSVDKEQHRRMLDFTKQLRQKGFAADFIPCISCSEAEIVEYAKKRNFSLLAMLAENRVLFQEIKHTETAVAPLLKKLFYEDKKFFSTIFPS